MISALLLSTLVGAGPSPGLDPGEAIQAVRRAFIEDGVDRVSATPTHRVISRADGSLELQGQQTLRLSLKSVRRERGASCQTQLSSREVDAQLPRRVRVHRECGVEETWTNEAAGLAHAFTVQRAPSGKGGLVLRIAVEGPWHHHDEGGHVFKGPGAAALLRYGNAFVLREGRQLPISVVHVEGGLELRVPQALVDAPGAFPMVIDPILTGELPLDPALTPSVLPTQEESPAIAVNSAGLAMVVWVDTRRQLGTDLYGARLNNTGALIDTSGLPLVVRPGHQLNPTLCAEGSSFLLAWEAPQADGGSEVWARTVNTAGVPGNEFIIAAGAEPALASMGDAGFSVLALVDPTSAVQVIPITNGTVGSTMQRPIANLNDEASRPAIAASNRSWFVAWENTPRGSSVSSIRGMASSPVATSATLVSVFDNATSVPARRPTVAMTTELSSDSAWIFWEEGQSISGAKVSPQAVPVFFDGANGRSPSLVQTSTMLGVQPKLGSFVGQQLQLFDLNDAGVANYPVSARVNDLVLATGGGRLVGAYTDNSSGSSDVIASAFASPATATTATISRAANTQLNPRVAWREGQLEGLAVWIDGNRVRAVKVGMDAGGDLRVATPFPVTPNQNQPIEHVDVAAAGAADRFLVTWRQGGLVTKVLAQFVTLSGVDGVPFELVPSGVIAGPAVSWVPDGPFFVVAWNQLEDSNFELSSMTVDTQGVLSSVRLHANGSARSVTLDCLKDECLLAWERTASPDVHATLIGVANTPLIVWPNAAQPAASNDGQSFFLGWRTAGGLGFGRVEYGSGNAMTLPVASAVSAGARVNGLSLAPGAPPVVAWSELEGDTVRVYLNRIDFRDMAINVGHGFAVHVDSAGAEAGPMGAVVYQRFVADAGSMRTYITGFSFPFDAGEPDAGQPDAGIDAGVDAGVTPGDGGVDPGKEDAGAMLPDGGVMVFETTGCACNSASTAPLLLLALLALRRRASPLPAQREEGGVRGSLHALSPSPAHARDGAKARDGLLHGRERLEQRRLCHRGLRHRCQRALRAFGMPSEPSSAAATSAGPGNSSGNIASPELSPHTCTSFPASRRPASESPLPGPQPLRGRTGSWRTSPKEPGIRACNRCPSR